MSFPGREAVLGQVSSLTIECADCGRTRMRRRDELWRYGVGDDVPLSQLCARLTCAGCRDEGLPGRRISVQVVFVSEAHRLKAEAYLINSRESRGSARRAKGV